MNQKSVIILGAGGRGNMYSYIITKHTDMFKVIGVADPNVSRRNKIRDEHNIDEANCTDDWKKLLDRDKMADCVFICTQDRMHYEPCMQAIEKGYDILLEKPISPNENECKEITKAAEKKGVKVLVCHVMRYAPLFTKAKELINEGAIGDVMSIHHLENVGHFHQAHSYVRGNWRNLKESAPMILAKCCHDTDLVQWLIGKKCTKVSSFGSLTHFTHKNKPEGSPYRCIEGCPKGNECPYNAVKLYLDDKENVWFRTASTLLANPTDADVEKALKEGPYGRCVYDCDNDVVDHQVVNMEFEGGATATLTMSGFTQEIEREMRIMGTKGEIHVLSGQGERNKLILSTFNGRVTEEIKVENNFESHIGHGGGDEGMIISLYELLNDSYNGCAISSVRTSCESHLIAFAAEKSRTEGKTVEMEDY